jgi:hypothetical protein
MHELVAQSSKDIWFGVVECGLHGRRNWKLALGASLSQELAGLVGFALLSNDTTGAEVANEVSEESASAESSRGNSP